MNTLSQHLRLVEALQFNICVLWELRPFYSIQQGKRVLIGLTQAIDVFKPEVTLLTYIHSSLERTYKVFPNYKEPGK